MSDPAAQHKQLNDPRSTSQIHPQHYTSDSADEMRACVDVCVRKCSVPADRIKHACTSPHNEPRSHDQALRSQPMTACPSVRHSAQLMTLLRDTRGEQSLKHCTSSLSSAPANLVSTL